MRVLSVRRARLAASIGVAILLTRASVSLAQDEPEDEGYRTLIRDAVEQGNDHHYQEALALFLRAHAMRPSARTHRGIGLVRFELSDYAGSIEALEAALADTRRPLDDAARAEAQQTLDRATQFVARVQLRVRPADARIDLDGHAVSLAEDGLVLLNPGRHQLTVEREGYRTETRLLDMEGAQQRRLEVFLAPDRAPAPTGFAGVHLEIDSIPEGLAMHAFAVSIDRERPTHTEVCVAPCVAALPAGVYELAISRGLERPNSVGEHALREPTHLLLEYADREQIRVAGYVLLPVSIALSIALFSLTVPLEGTAEDYSAIGAAIGTLTVGLAVSIPMLSLNNSARVTLEPLRPNEARDGL